MSRRWRPGQLMALPALAAVAVAAVGCSASDQSVDSSAGGASTIRIQLDGKDPSASRGELGRGSKPLQFKVGFGRNGIACQGTRFEEGWTPLGTFRVNAVLSADRFAMDPSLVEASGRSEDYLRDNLFRNMSAIDFKGDGETAEYGIGYISLTPVPATPQPFRFNTYDGQFRWYSFAIHGTNDSSRVGQSVTGGCINVGEQAMADLLKTVQLGDEVVITSESPCVS
ncbi:L,D-transpeptidase [Synechococcus sp. CS-197]|uniref:L,D-transpeptidase n=1 Tax=Synechococcus sp. CS-197 TaxID=2847985 RepID=UPI0001525BC2|nr:L,D-transpeptidase [Synechococcus sp. CS-197]CAK23171.1 Conserved hypothetical protein [Synechococcus sp. WH 7803]